MAGQDTLMKALTRSLSGGALEAVGVHGVELTEPVPTELTATTMRMDAAWRMMDGRIFHLEFQSTREPNLYRFLEYDVRLAQHHTTQIPTVVLYHADTVQAPDGLDIGTAGAISRRKCLLVLNSMEPRRSPRFRPISRPGTGSRPIGCGWRSR